MRSIRATLSASWSRSSRSELMAGSCRPLARLLPACCLVVGDEHSAALVRLDEPLAAKDVNPVADGRRRDIPTKSPGLLFPNAQRSPRSSPPAVDAVPQLVSHLQVRGARIVRLRLHLSSVRRPRQLGRIADLTEGLYLPLDCPSLSYIDLVQSSEGVVLWHFKVRSRSSSGWCSPTGAYAAGGDRDGAGLRPVQRGPGGPAGRQAHRAAAVGGRGDRRAGGRPAADGQGQDRRAGPAGAAAPGARVAVHRRWSSTA